MVLNYHLSKFQPYLPEELKLKLVAETIFDVEGTLVLKISVLNLELIRKISDIIKLTKKVSNVNFQINTIGFKICKILSK